MGLFRSFFFSEIRSLTGSSTENGRNLSEKFKYVFIALSSSNIRIFLAEVSFCVRTSTWCRPSIDYHLATVLRDGDEVRYSHGRWPLISFRCKQINHARNIFDRAVTILPRATQFWLKYSYMEELVENVPGARQVRPLLQTVYRQFFLQYLLVVPSSV